MPRQFLAAAGGGADRLDRLLFLRLFQPALQDLRVAGNDHQQVVEVVGDAAGELADRLHFLRLRELLARLFERDLRLALLGDVAHQLGEADQLARLAADRVHHNAGEEAAAVLAHQPEIALELALARRGDERLVGDVVLALLLGQEDAEMAADDLVGLVTLDALGAVVPAAHAPVGVEHVDRVIARAPEQQAVVLLGFAQGLLGLLALGDVDADAEHAHGTAIAAADHLARAVQMAHAAVGPDDALLVAEGFARLQRLADARTHLRAVVGVNEVHELVERAAEALGRHAVDLVQLVGPGDAVARDIPRPAAEIAEPLRFHEMGVGLVELGGALAHAAVELGLGTAQAVLAASAHGDVHRRAPGSAPTG